MRSANPRRSYLQRTLLVGVGALLCGHVEAGGLGWYYHSFDLQALNRYFGGGQRSDLREFLHHRQEVIEYHRVQPLFENLDRSRLALWRSFIEKGLSYKTMGSKESQFADELIGVLIFSDVPLSSLKVEAETKPDFIDPRTFRMLHDKTSYGPSSLLATFRAGRSWRVDQPRMCAPRKGEDWACHDAYVILDPDECVLLAKEISSIIDRPDFVNSALAEKTYLVPLIEALQKAATQKRALYLRTTD